jgi:predicted phage replisome organizer
MANEKRYYWLKFREDFFESKRIKRLRRMAGGDTYLIIYLKMQLKALKTGGVLQYTGVEDCAADEIALDIDEEPDNVKIVLTYLLANGLCECSDNINYLLPYVLKNTGSETTGTQRWRDWKNRKTLESNANLLESNATPTQLQQNANVEKEIEKEKDIEIDNIPPFIPPIQGEESENEPQIVKPKRKYTRKQFVPPTLGEIQEYISTMNLNVDPQAFYDYFTAPDSEGRTWIDSEGKPVRNWKQKIQTWSRKSGRTRPQKKNVADNFQEALRMLDQEGV